MKQASKAKCSKKVRMWAEKLIREEEHELKKRTCAKKVKVMAGGSDHDSGSV